MVGAQAATMPKLTSKTLASAFGTPSHVASADLTCDENAVRTMQMIPVLIAISVSLWLMADYEPSEKTYITPKPMSIHKATFVRLLIWTFHSRTTGKAAQMKSDNIEKAFEPG